MWANFGPHELILEGRAFASEAHILLTGISRITSLNSRGLRVGGAQCWQGFASAFFAHVAEVMETPWRLAANSDFAFPQTRGDRPPGLNDDDRYMAAVEELSAEEKEVQKLVWEVFNLAKPLSALSEEPLRSRVPGQDASGAVGEGCDDNIWRSMLRSLHPLKILGQVMFRESRVATVRAFKVHEDDGLIVLKSLRVAETDDIRLELQSLAVVEPDIYSDVANAVHLPNHFGEQPQRNRVAQVHPGCREVKAVVEAFGQRPNRVLYSAP